MRTSAISASQCAVDLVEVLQRSEGAAIEQVGFDILKRSFHFTFRLGTMRPAGPGLKAVMRGEGQKARVVDRLIPVITGHHDLHVVVQTGGGGTLQVVEGAHVFPDGGGKVLRFHEAHVLAARVTQYVTEGMHAAPAFGGERRCRRANNPFALAHLEPSRSAAPAVSARAAATYAAAPARWCSGL